MKKYIGTGLSVCIVLALVVLSVVSGNKGLTDMQSGTLKILVIVCGCSIAYCFVVGEITRNYSQMDKLWSLLPIAYAWIIAGKGGMKARLVIAALIVTLWGARLTMNFARKGAYKLKFWDGEEDYRWAIVRQNPLLKPRLAWALFDLFFISFYQNALVLAICLPLLGAMDASAPLGWLDVLAAVGALGFLLLETVADEQQWKFHQKKKRLLKERKELKKLPKPYSLGFNTFGLWNRMRHPNYLGEQGFWVCIYIFAIAAGVASKGVFHWTMGGCLLLVLLFVGSSALGESISSGKYPKYTDYAARVFKYLPFRKYR
mgnify:CR=1 FL=1